MRSIFRLTVCFCLLAAMRAEALDLVRGGKPVATLVVAPGASKAVRLAAEELQAIVQKVSGARMPLSTTVPAGAGTLVLVGTGAANLAGKDVLAAANLADVQSDGYAITAMPQHKPPCLTIVSKEPRGTLYGAYDLLERYAGCGFFVDGDHLPSRKDVSVLDAPLAGNPAHAMRLCYADTRFYGPKRFQATLWNAEDWKVYLRWMAKRKFNCIAINMTAESRSWGEAHDRAFPETKQAKTEAVNPRGADRSPNVTSRMGWGLAPGQVTSVLKEALTYARETLGMKTLYVLSYGQFEDSLQRAHPDLNWLAPSPTSLVGSAGQSAWLAATDAKCQDLQTRLWESIIKTYGKADQYLVFCRPDLSPTPSWASTIVDRSTKALERVDPDGAIAFSTSERGLWGKEPTERLEFLSKLPSGTSIFYLTTRAPDVSPLQDDRYNPKDHRRHAYSEIAAKDPDDLTASLVKEDVRDLPHYLPALVIAFELFAGRPYWYGCSWKSGPGHDLLENRYAVLVYHNLHRLNTPERSRAQGFCNWSPIQRTNPLMEHLCAEFAWRGYNVWRSEGGSDNRFTRFYLSRRYGVDDVSGLRPAATALKASTRGAPLGIPGANYRFYTRWDNADITGTPYMLDAIRQMLAFEERATKTPFYERDLAELSRTYLHQYIAGRVQGAMALLAKAKKAAKDQTYSNRDRNQNLEDLKKIDTEITRAHATLIRIISTRKDMSLDEAIIEATKTPGANRNLAQAIREHQSGTFADGFPLVDSIEYHKQLKAKQLRHLLDYVKQELTNPTDKAAPPWRQFSLHGAREFIERSRPVPYDQKAEETAPSEIVKEFLNAAG